MAKNRRNYPGDVRELGTKDYALILGNLIKYRNQLIGERDEEEVVKLSLKIAEKLRELGFKRAGTTVEKKVANKSRALSKREEILEIALEQWKEGKLQNDLAKEELKQKRKLDKKKTD